MISFLFSAKSRLFFLLYFFVIGKSNSDVEISKDVNDGSDNINDRIAAEVQRDSISGSRLGDRFGVDFDNYDADVVAAAIDIYGDEYDAPTPGDNEDRVVGAGAVSSRTEDAGAAEGIPPGLGSGRSRDNDVIEGKRGAPPASPEEDEEEEARRLREHFMKMRLALQQRGELERLRQRAEIERQKRIRGSSQAAPPRKRSGGAGGGGNQNRRFPKFGGGDFQTKLQRLQQLRRNWRMRQKAMKERRLENQTEKGSEEPGVEGESRPRHPQYPEHQEHKNIYRPQHPQPFPQSRHPEQHHPDIPQHPHKPHLQHHHLPDVPARQSGDFRHPEVLSLLATETPESHRFDHRTKAPTTTTTELIRESTTTTAAPKRDQRPTEIPTSNSNDKWKKMHLMSPDDDVIQREFRPRLPATDASGTPHLPKGYMNAQKESWRREGTMRRPEEARRRPEKVVKRPEEAAGRAESWPSSTLDAKGGATNGGRRHNDRLYFSQGGEGGEGGSGDAFGGVEDRDRDEDGDEPTIKPRLVVIKNEEEIVRPTATPTAALNKNLERRFEEEYQLGKALNASHAPRVCAPAAPDFSVVLESINEKLEVLTRRMSIMMEAPSRDEGGAGEGESAVAAVKGDIDLIVNKLAGQFDAKEKETQNAIASAINDAMVNYEKNIQTVKTDLEGLDTKANVQMIQTKSVAEQFADMERKMRVQGLNLMSLAKEFKTLDNRIGVQSKVLTRLRGTLAFHTQRISDMFRKGQKLFNETGVFVVPDGFTRLDVLCIGGGGGGRSAVEDGGDGGNSAFGKYLFAGGGKGGRAFGRDSGGWGGKGTVADGGRGGRGRGCSGGGGAAGQTSGGESALTAPGSSQFPFCGGGGCRGCNNCEEAGRSGPGGRPPIKRSGGLYGGGGGSCCGYRAGGGGGYSRLALELPARERVSVSVGRAGRPHDPNGASAPGVCIVAWGQSIDPHGIFT